MKIEKENEGFLNDYGRKARNFLKSLSDRTARFLVCGSKKKTGTRMNPDPFDTSVVDTRLDLSSAV